MLVNLVLSNAFFLARLRSWLEEAAQSFEKPHDFWFRQDIREDFKVSAELRESFESQHHGLLVSVELVVGHHWLVHAAKDLDNRIILQDLHQLDDLPLTVVTFLSLLDAFVKRCYVCSDQRIQRLSLTSRLKFIDAAVVVLRVKLVCDIRKSQHERVKVHAIQTTELFFFSILGVVWTERACETSGRWLWRQ